METAIFSFAAPDGGSGIAVPADGFFPSIRRGHREHFAVGTEFLQLCGAFARGKKHRKIRGDRCGGFYHIDGICVQYLRGGNPHTLEQRGDLYKQPVRYVGAGGGGAGNLAADTGSLADDRCAGNRNQHLGSTAKSGGTMQAQSRRLAGNDFDTAAPCHGVAGNRFVVEYGTGYAGLCVFTGVAGKSCLVCHTKHPAGAELLPADLLALDT